MSLLGTIPLGLAPLGGYPAPIAEITLPFDLAQAIKQRYTQNNTALAALTAIYETEAGDRPILPYLIYKILNGPDLLTTDIHYIYNQRVIFTVYAAGQPQANDLRANVHAAFGTGSYDFQTGFSIPFFQKNAREKKEPGRVKNVAYAFTAEIEYDARTHRS